MVAAAFWIVGLIPAGDVWPEFNSFGGVGQGKAPTTWSEASNLRWKTPIHGKGWASPVVWNNQIWCATATEDGKQLSAVCVDRESGKIIHDIKVLDVSDPEFCHPTNSYASCTPAIEEGRIYVHFGTYGTACLDTTTGKTIWERRDLPCDHFRGPASSPIIHNGKLYINFDGVDIQYVACLDKTDGRTVWKKDRSTEYGDIIGDAKKAYSTPEIIEVNGQKQLVSAGAVATIAYDPETGAEIWRFRHGGMNAGCRPRFHDGIIYLNAGAANNALVALKLGRSGDLGDSDVLWRSSRNAPQKPSPIYWNGMLFTVADNGVVSCLDAKTGEAHWRERAKGDYWSSPLLVDGKLYCSSQQGQTFVFAADKKPKQLAINTLDDGGNASPIALGNAIYLRTRTHLYRLEEK
jgi:outer membrane protein assembly factor BamB